MELEGAFGVALLAGRAGDGADWAAAPAMSPNRKIVVKQMRNMGRLMRVAASGIFSSTRDIY
ncbi:hypothetical protein ACM43_23715 [Bradyrhizobium sp. CCBAU 45321]|nr:hypothetical protein [Bradyrhizobium sp. CCBAU 45321]